MIDWRSFPGKLLHRVRLASASRRRRASQARTQRCLGAVERLEARTLMSASPWSGRPYIDLGPSDNIALDQPRVAIELFKNADGSGSLGPEAFNTILLDTGANSILLTESPLSEMKPLGYKTQGKFEEHGVAGSQQLDISVPYRFDFAGSDGERFTLDAARILTNPLGDFSIMGPWGLAGMPAMVNRVTTLDFSGWSGGLDPDFENLYMGVSFAPQLPQASPHRYSVSVDNRVRFDPLDQMISGDPPAWADIPFLTAVPMNLGHAQPGDFVFDTGAQLSVISTDMAMALGLDTNHDGQLDDGDDGFDGWEIVGGIGGEIAAPAFGIAQVHLPTDQGVDLVWTDLRWLVTDIAPEIDGVIGSDLLTSGWFEAFFLGAADGHLDKVHFDFRNMAVDGTGKLYFDVNQAKDQVISPAPNVVGRYLFYNNSAFDGYDPSVNAQDDSALAPDKTPLLPGGAATFQNYSSYTRGLNGVMIDVANLPPAANIDLSDFAFRLGNTSDPSAWIAAPAPHQVTLRRGVGLNGSDRITLAWPDNAIQQQWLQITVLANADTGLSTSDVFYFGNAIAESGDSPADARVTTVDILRARNNPRSFFNPASIDSACDFNRDLRVNALDMLLARSHQTSALTALKLISVPQAMSQQAASQQPPLLDVAPVSSVPGLEDLLSPQSRKQRAKKDVAATTSIDPWLTVSR